MPGFDAAAIMQRLNAWSETTAGAKRIQQVIDDYKKRNVHETAAGSRIISDQDMYVAAGKLINVLRSTARDYGLAPSVIALFDTLDHSSIIEMPDGSATIYVYFTGDKHRDSLYPEGYEGGIDNIVALLNNGYHAGNYVYGWWDGHSDSAGGYTDLRNAGMDSSVWIRSRKDFDGLHFIQQAVRDFNGNYGSDYNVTAIAGEEYH